MDNINIMPAERTVRTVSFRMPEEDYNKFKNKLMKEDVKLRYILLTAIEKYMEE